MKTIGLESVEKHPVLLDGAVKTFKQAVLSSADGAPRFSFRVFTVQPGGQTPYHTHAAEHMNYIIRGEGVLVDAAGREHPVREGDFALVLPEEKHQYRNASSDTDFVFICAVPVQYE